MRVLDDERITEIVNIFSWDKQRVGELHVALNSNDLHRALQLMRESEQELLQQLVGELFDEGDRLIHNAKVESIYEIQTSIRQIEEYVSEKTKNIFN